MLPAFGLFSVFLEDRGRITISRFMQKKSPSKKDGEVVASGIEPPTYGI